MAKITETDPDNRFLQIEYIDDFGIQADPPIPYDTQRRCNGLIVRVKKEEREWDGQGVLRIHDLIMTAGDIAVAAKVQRGDTRTVNFMMEHIAAQADRRSPDLIKIDRRAGTTMSVGQAAEAIRRIIDQRKDIKAANTARR
ncbi:hypothetical protein HYW35_01980 [Candidatus Saccharibacteria bacterium]|nr:hypothetical protein [Candidatus Saccharibacteria bacterium]